MASHFNYQLTPYPMSLFKDGMMCSTKKSLLQTFLLKNVKETDSAESTRIIDGAALLWNIWENYSNFLSYHSVVITVFDGYAPSTKDAT